MNPSQHVDPVIATEAVLVSRQVIAIGRVSDGLSGAGLADFTLALGCRDERGSGMLPVDLTVGAGGWFAAHLNCLALPGDFPQGTQFSLTADLAAYGHQPLRLQLQVPAASFQRVSWSLARHPDSSLTRLAGPPVQLEAPLLPLPVGLRGIVVYDHDPALPVPGADVEVQDAAPVTTDALGRFSIAQLPLAARVQVRVSDGTHAQTHHLVVDYGQPVNVATLSLTRSNVE
ncbi:carboxypeptidase-like regulatory domain-containing protein [Glutamicibacter soli]|uniref:Carboxypeptidase regulatory-like domain-containing protein n=1 Tax=Glutamicibacter soli TaxID=453836 RepID=A0A6L9G1G1_9MICC|nr:carboxypeptidase-like regulatory domain-containing protein [Glutamicibacter soli]NAZ14737.1 hypothetical protein [Glutamicibacter soli]